ncbi:hypothetical protein PV327_007479 [Microctonus hyperodae]|uniref:Uncharacterized protein n=1 Tax=Microctonus hyperodae TaxID=165561 RepID=A0AA39KYR3_MICHY|nr:hypothetical protein PV327_007479 [Microctonus hyperodae]
MPFHPECSVWNWQDGSYDAKLLQGPPTKFLTSYLQPVVYEPPLLHIALREIFLSTVSIAQQRRPSPFQNIHTKRPELLFRGFETACEESGACKTLSQQRSSVGKTRCIRECVSPSCYREIYLFDQLEEGEIDVRLNSFKGCFMQRNGRPRK